MKFCKDCQNFRDSVVDDYFGFYSPASCGILTDPPKYDPVHGERLYMFSGRPSEFREGAGVCGPDAKYFVPKE